MIAETRRISRQARDFTEAYHSALKEYVSGANEAAIRRAYELGRVALAEGMGVLELAALHEKCAAKLAAEMGPTRTEAFHFLLESLAPYETVFRGLQEADAKLRQSLRELMLTEDTLRRQNEKLSSAHQALAQERKRYRELFEFAPDAYLVTDFTGKIRKTNRALAALLCAPQVQLDGRRLSEFVVDQEREGFERQLREFKDGDLEKIDDWQLSLQPADGPSIQLSVAIGAERDVDGALSGLRWLLRDVTKRKRAEEERTQYLVSHAEAEAARRFEFLAEASSLLASSLDYEATLASVARLTVPYLADWCFVHLVEEDGSIYQLQPAHAHAVDPELAQDLDRLGLLEARRRIELGIFAHVVRPKIINGFRGKWLEDVAGGTENATILLKLGFRTAMIVPFVARDRALGALTLIAAQSGRIYCQTDLALAEDLAHRCALAIENARLYRQVIRERDKAEKASRAKDEFLAILSHELKNPLMPVMSWTRMLKNHRLISQDSTLSEGVKSLERNAQNISRLVNDCLDLARISQGKIEMKSEVVDLNQIILAAMEAVREMAGDKKLSLIVDLACTPPRVSGDATRLQQVIMNLLVNAIKYTPNTGAISIQSWTSENAVVIQVKDTGEGIDSSFLQHVFEPFRQGTSTWLTSDSGLGLGLAISRKIVEMHNGRIWAESQGLGLGTTFRVQLPIAAAPDSQLECVPPDPEPVRQADAVKILVIEDAEDILFILKVELESRGFSVLTATNGLKGLELARHSIPDLIISDIKMPGLDGYELIRTIRTTQELAAIPAIALTGFGMQNDIDQLRAAGFNCCISKPADVEDMLPIIQELTGT